MCNPEILSDIEIEKVVITSSYLKEIKPQVLKLGVPEELIVEPSKKDGSLQLFHQKSVRLEAAKRLHSIMSLVSDTCQLVAVGGTALGFVRERDFIHWDDDIDLFAPLSSKVACITALVNSGFEFKEIPGSIMQAMITSVPINNQLSVPLCIEFFNSDGETIRDTFEDYTWEWPTSMFTSPSTVNVHGFSLNVPNPPDEYLSKVFGSSWATPNPEFGYSDYQGEKKTYNG